jgi:hypothetical protein
MVSCICVHSFDREHIDSPNGRLTVSEGAKALTRSRTNEEAITESDQSCRRPLSLSSYRARDDTVIAPAPAPAPSPPLSSSAPRKLELDTPKRTKSKRPFPYITSSASPPTTEERPILSRSKTESRLDREFSPPSPRSSRLTSPRIKSPRTVPASPKVPTSPRERRCREREPDPDELIFPPDQCTLRLFFFLTF